MTHGLRVVCGAECKKIRDKQTTMAWQREHKQKQKKLYELTCAVCGKTMVTNKPNKKACSDECKKIYSKKAQKEADERHKQKQKEMLEEQKNKPKAHGLARFNEEARAMGMTYGQYDAYLRLKGKANQ